MKKASALTPIRVVVADDDPRIRRVLVDLISGESSLDLVGVASRGDEAVLLCADRSPDVVLMDVRMPAGGGIEAVRELQRQKNPPRVIALSAYADSGVVKAMLRAGAVGYLVKGAEASTVVDAIHGAARGEASLSADVTSDVVSEFRKQLVQEYEEGLNLTKRVDRIRGILDGEGLGILYQPIVRLEGLNPVGFEALSRFSPEPIWPPDVWFAEAQALGLGVDLELAAIQMALANLDRIPDQSYLALNVGPELLVSRKLPDALADTDLGRIVLEVTEHAPIDDYQAVEEALQPLRINGLRLAVDDAGSGFASLRHILLIAPSIIKLDITLIRHVDSDPRLSALAKSLITFASETGATTLGEGVETTTELQALTSLGVNCAQGYLLGRPMTADVAFGSPESWAKG